MSQPGDRTPAPGALALVQDFVNTVDFEAEQDLLRTADDLIAFCREHGLPTDGFTDADVETCRRAREALRDAAQAHSGVDIPEESQRVLDELFRAAPLTLHITPRGEALLMPSGESRGAGEVLAALAVAVNSAVAEGTWPRLKACGAETCRWVYYDKSPAGRGRWCTMSLCGSRAKMRAYRRKKGAA